MKKIFLLSVILISSFVHTMEKKQFILAKRTPKLLFNELKKPCDQQNKTQIQKFFNELKEKKEYYFVILIPNSEKNEFVCSDQNLLNLFVAFEKPQYVKELLEDPNLPTDIINTKHNDPKFFQSDTKHSLAEIVLKRANHKILQAFLQYSRLDIKTKKSIQQALDKK